MTENTKIATSSAISQVNQLSIIIIMLCNKPSFKTPWIKSTCIYLLVYGSAGPFFVFRARHNSSPLQMFNHLWPTGEFAKALTVFCFCFCFFNLLLVSSIEYIG